MSYKNSSLPEYPYKGDMWEMLSAQTRPVVVYGMGNGADKLLKRFERYNITVSDFFASDSFVRGHSFHGMRVKSFSEIRETYDDFVIVLSFASNRPEVLSMLYEIDEKYDMYVPDMPVAGEDEYFDAEFYNKNHDAIVRAYESLCDDSSKRIFSSVIHYKLTGRMKYLREAISSREAMYSRLPRKNIKSIIDAGAYNGDTIREAKCFFETLEKVLAIEPDARNFKKLAKYCEAEDKINITAFNVAAWSEDSHGAFSDSGNRNSSVSSTVSFQHRDTTVQLARIDTLATDKTDYIKYDVEGAESEALVGSDKTIMRDRPALVISVYHRSRDIFELVNTVHARYPFYRLYLCRLECVPAWEINLLAIPETEDEI